MKQRLKNKRLYIKTEQIWKINKQNFKDENRNDYYWKLHGRQLGTADESQ